MMLLWAAVAFVAAAAGAPFWAILLVAMILAALDRRS